MVSQHPSGEVEHGPTYYNRMFEIGLDGPDCQLPFFGDEGSGTFGTAACQVMTL